MSACSQSSSLCRIAAAPVTGQAASSARCRLSPVLGSVDFPNLIFVMILILKTSPVLPASVLILILKTSPDLPATDSHS